MGYLLELRQTLHIVIVFVIQFHDTTVATGDGGNAVVAISGPERVDRFYKTNKSSKKQRCGQASESFTHQSRRPRTDLLG